MSCDFCGALLPEGILVCPPCGRLVHGKRLAAKAREAEELEQRGELAAARDAWAATLAWLPEDAMQASEIRARVAKLDGKTASSAGSGGGGGLKGAAGLAGVAGALLLGLKTKVGLLLALVKSSKVLVTGLTMLASIWVYTSFLGLPFAALFVGLIWVHEMGHVVVLRWYGVPASAPVFVPFVGAFVRMKQQAPHVLADAWCGLAGPIAGSLGAFAALAGGRALGSDLLLAAGHVAIGLNLFNLTPLYPLDGGRAAQALTPRLWVVALVAAFAVAWQLAEPLVAIAAFLPFGRIVAGARARELGGPLAAFHEASPARRLTVLAVYAGLVALLVATFGHFQPELEQIRKKHGHADLAWITSESD